MQLLDFEMLAKTYDKKMCGQIHNSIDRIMKALNDSGSNFTGYRAFLQLLGSMDMVECIGERYRLFQIQR